jgi:acyl-CoA thioester hydrolase
VVALAREPQGRRAVEQVRAASVAIQQRVMRGDELLTDARVIAALLDANGRPQRQPKQWVDTFKAIAEAE